MNEVLLAEQASIAARDLLVLASNPFDLRALVAQCLEIEDLERMIIISRPVQNAWDNYLKEEDR
jgi:hypothetical protein